MKLIDNWRDAPRLYSVQAFSLIATIQAAAAYLSAEQLVAVLFTTTFLNMGAVTLGGLIHSATAFLGVTGVFARLISQEKP